MTDRIAAEVLRELAQDCKSEISTQYRDNIRWIEEAENHALVVGSKARILYADEQGRLQIALAFNHAIKEGKISAPIVLGKEITMTLEAPTAPIGKPPISKMAQCLPRIWQFITS